MRRLLAAAAVAALGLSVALPLVASAHVSPDHSIKWTASPDPTTANDGSQVWSNDEVVAATVNFTDGVTSWDVVIRPVSGGAPSTCHEEFAGKANTGEFPKQVLIHCPWDTTRATEHTLPGKTPYDQAQGSKTPRVWQSRDLGPAVNGKYTIEITVYNAAQRCGLLTGCAADTRFVVEPHQLFQQDSNPPRWREVFVVNEAAAPTGVASAFDPTTNRIDVTWAPNPEPDVSYMVQEKVGDGKWSSGEGAPANRFSRTIEQPGKYQYRVAAVRPAPSKDNGGATKRSDFVAASVVEVAQITPPSTAPGPNGADGAPADGDQGVFIPTDPTSPTPATAGGKAGKPGSKTTGRSGPTAFRPGTSGRAPGSTAHTAGEAEGEGPDEGFSPALPYDLNQGDEEMVEDDGLSDEGDVQTLAGGVVPKPRDTRGLMIYMASALTLFVFAMQITFMLRRSRPALAGGAAESQSYHDDFDDWLGY